MRKLFKKKTLKKKTLKEKTLIKGLQEKLVVFFRIILNTQITKGAVCQKV